MVTNKQNTDLLIEMAVTKGAHGIKGAVKLFLYNPQNTSLKKNLKVYCVSQNLDIPPRWLTIKEFNVGNNVIASFKEIEDRTALEKIIPFKLSIKKEDLIELEENQYFIRDLLESSVFSWENNDEKIGEVIDYREVADHINLIIKLNQEVETIELPFTQSFFPKIDLNDKKIWIVLPEYIDG